MLFKECYEILENNTTWKYNGGTDLIAMVVAKDHDKLRFNYKNAIAVSIDSLDTDGKFDLGRYVVDLINSAKVSSDDPFGEIGKNDAITFLVSCVRFALPASLKGMLDSALKANLRRPIDISRT
jgi:hypothetical protein